MIAKPHAEGMVSLIATAAKSEHVCLFNRFALMRQWHEADRMPFETFLSPDGLHMNDWSYGCLAKWLGGGDRRGGHTAGGDRGGAGGTLSQSNWCTRLQRGEQATAAASQ